MLCIYEHQPTPPYCVKAVKPQTRTHEKTLRFFKISFISPFIHLSRKTRTYSLHLIYVQKGANSPKPQCLILIYASADQIEHQCLLAESQSPITNWVHCLAATEDEETHTSAWRRERRSPCWTERPFKTFILSPSTAISRFGSDKLCAKSLPWKMLA